MGHTTGLKPMLSGKLKSLDDLEFPCYCTPKLDGIRCLIWGGKAVSRNLKPIRNKYVQAGLKDLPDGLDGELVLQNTKNFNEVSSAIMSEEGEPEFRYVVFDVIMGTTPYLERMRTLDVMVPIHRFAWPLFPKKINDLDEFLQFERESLEAGFEGIMIRKADGPYKYGRSSAKEGYLLKWKRFTDSEAEVIGFVEQFHNANPKEKDALGNSKRSQHKENLIPEDTLGSLLVRDLKTGIEFSIGTGFDAETRADLWIARDSLVGKIVKYRYQKAGVKEAPRFPVFLGFRHMDDMPLVWRSKFGKAKSDETK